MSVADMVRTDNVCPSRAVNLPVGGTMSVITPNYPNKYGSYENCILEVTVPEDHHIKVECINFLIHIDASLINQSLHMDNVFIRFDHMIKTAPEINSINLCHFQDFLTCFLFDFVGQIELYPVTSNKMDMYLNTFSNKSVFLSGDGCIQNT